METIIAILLAIPCGLFRGYALTKGIEWFLAPLGCPTPSIVQAWGIMVLSGMFTSKSYKGVKDSITLLACSFIETSLILLWLLALSYFV